MFRFVTRRLLFGLLTLTLLSVIVFVAAQVLPGNVGRNILGPFATQSQVDLLNEQLGANRPVLEQYLDWVHGVLAGDFGTSAASGRPITDIVMPALENSAKLAGLTVLLMVPMGIVGGLLAAVYAGRTVDRFLLVTASAMTSVPEFVWGVLAIAVLGLHFELLPVTAAAPEGSGVLEQVGHLILPSLPLVLVLYGYIMRVMRASSIEVLRTDYVRTAYLKGASTAYVLFRHLLPNALAPTITVVATQIGYLFGGLVTIELIFNYAGIGYTLYQAALNKDFPLLATSVLIMGAVFLAATLIADLISAYLNPRTRVSVSR